VAAVQKPEEWPRTFTERLNAGDLDGIVALYAPDARFVTPMGDVLVGRDAIRPVLAGLVAARTRFASRVVRAVRPATSRCSTPTSQASRRGRRSGARRSRCCAGSRTAAGC
jgi:uncharacterized protein (TIGR02246 family)